MLRIGSKEEFKKLIAKIESQKNYKKPIGFAIGRVDRGQKNLDKILQVNFPIINWNENFGSSAIFIYILQEIGLTINFNNSEFIADINRDFINRALNIFNPFLQEIKENNHKNIEVIQVLKNIKNINSNFKIIFIFNDENSKSVEVAYLKLYALSQQKVKLRSLNLNGIFGLLENVAWSKNYPYELDYLRENEINMKLNGTFPNIDSVDKFPRFLQHIIPADNTRILESSKVRFGAQVADGTTVMPGASYINFNAGTLGAVMVEGRISSSAIVGKGSDIGGGASILGVLSGTDGNPISIGENSLLGANSTVGVSIGDGSIVDGGLSIFAGTKIYISDEEIIKIQKVNKDIKLENIEKAKNLQKLNGIHFRQDSKTGKYILKRSQREIKLNKELH